MKTAKEKDRGDGCIFILAGASTAGKTSICNEVKGKMLNQFICRLKFMDKIKL
jgi:adenylylsulfate kinase-like enzyme